MTCAIPGCKIEAVTRMCDSHRLQANATKRTWRARNVDKARRLRRESRWRYLGIVGMTEELYQQMFEDQKGLCAVCDRPSDRALDVDHDHETGEPRGLLCSNCNTAIGLLGDDEQRAYRVASYLQTKRAVVARQAAPSWGKEY